MMKYLFIYKKKGVMQRQMNLAASEHCVHCKGDTSLMYFNLTLHGRNLPRRSVLAAFLDTMIIKFEILFFFFLNWCIKAIQLSKICLWKRKKSFPVKKLNRYRLWSPMWLRGASINLLREASKQLGLCINLFLPDGYSLYIILPRQCKTPSTGLGLRVVCPSVKKNITKQEQVHSLPPFLFYVIQKVTGKYQIQKCMRKSKLEQI